MPDPERSLTTEEARQLQNRYLTANACDCQDPTAYRQSIGPQVAEMVAASMPVDQGFKREGQDDVDELMARINTTDVTIY